MLEFSQLKEKQLSVLSSNNDAFIRYPGLTQVINGFQLLKRMNWSKVTLAVAKLSEESKANNTELRVVQRVKDHLYNIKTLKVNL